MSEATRDQELKKLFLGMRAGDTSEEFLLENDESPRMMLDFDGQPHGLVIYQYQQMKNLSPLTVVVKKGTEEQKMAPQLYKNLHLLNHRLLVPVLNFYDKGSGMVVFSYLDGSLDKWLDLNGCDLLLQVQGNGTERRFSPTFRTIIIDLCSLSLKMGRKGLYPMNMALEDFFVKITVNSGPKILLMITQFKQLNRSFFTPAELQQFWSSVDSIVENICNKCGCQLTESSQEFLDYVKGSKGDSLLNITFYPDVWTSDEKAAYLYHIIAAQGSKITGGRGICKDSRTKVNVYSGISWPCNTTGQIMPVLEAIRNLPRSLIREKDGTVKFKYDVQYPHDYLQLCRNSHKHFFKLPLWIQKELGGSPQAFIDLIEFWDPKIWKKLYEELGSLGREL